MAAVLVEFVQREQKMNLTGIHFILTYACTYECDHCFLFSSPEAKGTFTLADLDNVLAQAKELGTVDWIYFEGGEPFLFYRLMIEGMKHARDLGFKVGIVTNGYWAITPQDAELWLRPLAEYGISDLSVSDDAYHNPEGDESTAKHALAAARNLGIPTAPIIIDQPQQSIAETGDGVEVDSAGGCGVMFKGRAVETLTEELTLRSCASCNSCPHEDLRSPQRVHVDPYGHVHLCQGLTFGNLLDTRLTQLVEDYDPDAHPLCGPLLEGGPARLAEVFGVPVPEDVADECHLCFLVRRELIGRFPQYLTPRQVFGLE